LLISLKELRLVTYNATLQRRQTMLSLTGPAIVTIALVGIPGAYASLISATGISVVQYKCRTAIKIAALAWGFGAGIWMYLRPGRHSQ
jgi:hypothetical protein